MKLKLLKETSEIAFLRKLNGQMGFCINLGNDFLSFLFKLLSSLKLLILLKLFEWKHKKLLKRIFDRVLPKDRIIL